MNSRTTLLAAIVAALLLGGAVAWMSLSRPGAPAPRGTLAGADIGGTFALVDQDGKPRTDKDFAGKYRLMYFGYTFCPDVCPTDMQKLTQGFAAFEKADPGRAAKVQPIFVTVDPARDTPNVVKEWVAAFDPRIVGLTGTPDQVAQVLKVFRVYAQKAGTGPNYLMDHSAMIYLFGPDGKPIDFLAQDSTPAEITAKLEAFVR